MTTIIVRNHLKYAEDAERIAETLNNTSSFRIDDVSSFKRAYSIYFGRPIASLTVKEKEFMNEVLISFQKRFRTQFFTGDQKQVFREAKGKEVKLDRRRTAKTVVKTKEEYIRRGASKVDLKGLDTKTLTVRRDSFTFTGFKKDKIVFARRIQTRRGFRYIDRKGQYVRVVKD